MEKEMLENLDKIESESKTSNFIFMGFVIFGIIILVVISFFVIGYFWKQSSEINLPINNSLQGDVNQTLNEMVNETLNNVLNQTPEDLNETNVSIIDNGSVPNPTGSIKILKIRSDDGEYFCNNDEIDAEWYTCPGSCENGKCVDSSSSTEGCEDSDNGKNYYTKGTASNSTYLDSDHCTYVQNEDYYYIYEVYCEGNAVKSEQVNCTNGCSNGACIQ